jgi:hypothetical protein
LEVDRNVEHGAAPGDFEVRLDEFTKLLAAAIANAEATG